MQPLRLPTQGHGTTLTNAQLAVRTDSTGGEWLLPTKAATLVDNLIGRALGPGKFAS
ncbi:MAG: hypothetical protein KA914_08255 [Ottowia sp.]|nr:hypothetical protein [Ottowia sp.]